MGKGIGGPHSPRANTEVWLTPPHVLAALGPFDLDPCAALGQPWATAAHHFTVEDDGLSLPWFGSVWCNPPYTARGIADWLGKLRQHGDGVALIFARTETAAFQRHVWEAADGLLFLERRLFFHVAEATDFKVSNRVAHVPKGEAAPANGGAPSVLCAYGAENVDRLAASGLAGALVPLKLRAFALGFETVGTWAQEVAKAIAGRNEPVTLDWLYRALAGSEKAARNPNWKAKIRQTPRCGGIWRLA